MTSQLINCCIDEAPIAYAPKSTLRCALCKVIAVVKLTWTTMEERHALRNLDEHALRDIGINRLQAINESDRAPWDLPMERLEDS